MHLTPHPAKLIKNLAADYAVRQASTAAATISDIWQAAVGVLCKDLAVYAIAFVFTPAPLKAEKIDHSRPGNTNVTTPPLQLANRSASDSKELTT